MAALASRRGVVLPATLLVVMILAILASCVLGATRAQVRAEAHHWNSVRLRVLGESALEEARARLIADALVEASMADLAHALGEPSSLGYDVSVTTLLARDIYPGVSVGRVLMRPRGRVVASGYARVTVELQATVLAPPGEAPGRLVLTRAQPFVAPVYSGSEVALGAFAATSPLAVCVVAP